MQSSDNWKSECHSQDHESKVREGNNSSKLLDSKTGQSIYSDFSWFL